MLRDIVKILNSSDLFTDIKPLEIGYTPRSLDEVIHRDKEIEALTYAVKDVNKGHVPRNLFIYGKTGTGKTTLTNVILEEIQQVIPHKLAIIKISCPEFKSTFQVLSHLVRKLEEINKMPAAKLQSAVGTYFMQAYRIINNSNLITIIIFDEVDFLKDPQLLNQLARIKENHHSNKNVCLIAITNSLTFKDSLDTRTISVLSENEIYFYPYNAEELENILNSRASMALRPDAYTKEVISLCAALSAREHGDARKAIYLLYKAALYAQKESRKSILEEDVYAAENGIHDDRFNAIIHGLPLQSKAVLTAIKLLTSENAKPATTKSIATVSDLVCKELDTKTPTYRTVYNLINELDMLGLVKVSKISRGDRKGVTNTAIINVPIDEALLTDPQFKIFLNLTIVSHFGKMNLKKNDNKKISGFI